MGKRAAVQKQKQLKTLNISLLNNKEYQSRLNRIVQYHAIVNDSKILSRVHS